MVHDEALARAAAAAVVIDVDLADPSVAAPVALSDFECHGVRLLVGRRADAAELVLPEPVAVAIPYRPILGPLRRVVRLAAVPAAGRARGRGCGGDRCGARAGPGRGRNGGRRDRGRAGAYRALDGAAIVQPFRAVTVDPALLTHPARGTGIAHRGEDMPDQDVDHAGARGDEVGVAIHEVGVIDVTAYVVRGVRVDGVALEDVGIAFLDDRGLLLIVAGLGDRVGLGPVVVGVDRVVGDRSVVGDGVARGCGVGDVARAEATRDEVAHAADRAADRRHGAVAADGRAAAGRGRATVAGLLGDSRVAAADVADGPGLGLRADEVLRLHALDVRPVGLRVAGPLADAIHVDAVVAPAVAAPTVGVRVATVAVELGLALHVVVVVDVDVDARRAAGGLALHGRLLTLAVRHDDGNGAGRLVVEPAPTEDESQDQAQGDQDVLRGHPGLLRGGRRRGMRGRGGGGGCRRGGGGCGARGGRCGRGHGTLLGPLGLV